MSPSRGGVGKQASTKPDLLKSFLLVKVKITDEGRKWILQDCFAMCCFVLRECAVVNDRSVGGRV